MTRCQADSWSNTRSLAFLAAVLAIMLASLTPFAAMAASTPGHPTVLCTTEGPRTVQVGADLDGPAGKVHPPQCAACVMPLLAALPAPPATEPAPPPRIRGVPAFELARVSPPPPARAPPRPPSTAPPHA